MLTSIAPVQPGALRPHFENEVVLTRVVEIVLRPHFGRRRMVYLERFNLLAEIGGVSADMDYIANPQRTALELDGRE
jgi:hypothetical protein